MKFSVLLPTRNRLNLLRFAVETVLRQDYDDWEIVVSDNASQEDICGFVDSLADERVIYVRSEKSIPVTDNWNLALSRCSGDYIIMLGDDDGLLPGYFSHARELIDVYQHPEVLYTGALLYAYPGVLPDAPDGFVRSYEERSIFQGSKQPFMLSKEEASAFVDASLDFRVTFDYNMQFFLVSRRAVERLQAHGAFYQSPYPDYYAANALLHVSPSVLIVPTPMVTIGISPKSFGYYYFNNKESEGTAFLDNMNADQTLAHLDRVILPGTDMNTCWLMAMETFALRFGRKANHKRYREIQIRTILAGVLRHGKIRSHALVTLQELSTLQEKLRFLWPLFFVGLFLPEGSREKYAAKFMMRSQSHTAANMPLIPGMFTNITKVYEFFTRH
jgi:hypothetical protein